MGVVEELVRAREAYDRHEWVVAYDGLSEPSPEELTADDFARLATVAYLMGRRNDCIQALQRAHAAQLESADVRGAVRSAFWLAMVLIENGESAVAGGWVARAQRQLEDLDEDVVERGYVLIHLFFQNLFSGQPERAHELAVQVLDYGGRFADPDLLAMGRCFLGRVLMYLGQVPEGLALLDEAMAAVSAGEVSPIFAGQIYCAMIEACQEVADFGRAAEWTTMLNRWCESQVGLVAFTGQCAVHRGQIMRVRGAFKEALDEFDRAQQRYLDAGSSPAAGLAWAERGEVLRIRGDHDAAEESFERAVAFGHDPQPSLSMLRLAQGRTPAAAAAMRRLLAEPRDPVHRCQILPAATEVLLAEGEVEQAVEVSTELDALAERFRCTALRAAAKYARGHVLLARGEHADAVPLLQQAARLWTGLDAPYETARCRALLGLALRGLGDEESGLAELTEARRTFVRLGAATDEREVAGLLAPSGPNGLTSREVEVLRLVATGLSNPEIAAELVLSEKTVARHLSNIFTKLDVRSRTAAAAFAFEHRLA
jgi:ATP/maltotriose-dependent transcriptional regulator MalT